MSVIVVVVNIEIESKRETAGFTGFGPLTPSWRKTQKLVIERISLSGIQEGCFNHITCVNRGKHFTGERTVVHGYRSDLDVNFHRSRTSSSVSRHGDTTRQGLCLQEVSVFVWRRTRVLCRFHVNRKTLNFVHESTHGENDLLVKRNVI